MLGLSTRRGVAALALAVAGCTAPRPAPTDPALGLPGAYAQAPDPGDEAPPPGPWWKRLGDPALDALMERAFAGNLDLGQTRARLAQRLAAARAADAARGGHLALKGQGSAERQPGLVAPAETWGARLSLEASYEVDLWGRLADRSRAEALDARAVREELKALYLAVSARLADLHYLAAEVQAQLALVDQAVAVQADVLERVEGRYRAGLAPAADLYQSRHSLAATQARRPPFEAVLAEAHHGIAALIGAYPGAYAPPAAALPPAPPELPPGLPAQLLTRRPDLVAALARLEAADARAAAAVADQFPSVNLLLGFGSVRTWLEAGTVTGAFVALLGGLTAPLWDGGRREAEADRARETAAEAALAYRRAVLEAVRDVEDALARGRATDARLGALADRVQAAGDTHRAAVERYRHGLTDYLPVALAEAALLDARGQHLGARRQLLSDRIGLMRALGGDWMEDAISGGRSAPGETR